MRKMIMAAAVLGASLLSTTANATTLVFTMTGTTTASWQMDSNPVSASPVSGNSFRVNGITATVNGVTGTNNFTFWNTSQAGGLSIQPQNLVFDGVQLYTGTEAAPQFRLGTFSLVNTFNGDQRSSLTIATANTAVPEPAAWAMMLAGFAITGAAMRRRAQPKLAVSYS